MTILLALATRTLRRSSSSISPYHNLLKSSFSLSTTSSSSSSSVPAPIPSPESIAVKAIYVAGSIDLKKIEGAGRKIYGLSRRQYDQRSVVVSPDASKNQHIALFNYGSVVFFNIPEEEQEKHIKFWAASNAFSDGNYNLTENYKVLIHQNLEKPSVVKAEHINIRALDFNNVTIIGTVMAQSVALDYLATKVENMFETFLKLNKKAGGSNKLALPPLLFSSKDIRTLFSLANVISSNLLSKMGILEVTEAAWENADYTYTWDELRRDFEIEYRYRDLKSKLELIKENSRFFLEVNQHRNSLILEGLIIILITIEVVQEFSK